MAQNTAFNLNFPFKDVSGNRNAENDARPNNMSARDIYLSDTFKPKWGSSLNAPPKEGTETTRSSILRRTLYARSNTNLPSGGGGGGAGPTDGCAPSGSGIRTAGLDELINNDAWKATKSRLSLGAALRSPSGRGQVGSGAAAGGEESDTEMGTSEMNLEDKLSDRTNGSNGSNTSMQGDFDAIDNSPLTINLNRTKELSKKDLSASHKFGGEFNTRYPYLSSWRNDSGDGDLGLHTHGSGLSHSHRPMHLSGMHISRDTTNGEANHKMNSIIALGLMLSVGISKTLEYLAIYFQWFKKQVLQLRTTILGGCTMWELVNFEDTERCSLRTKLMIMPLVGICTLLYALISVLHWVTGIMLAQLPVGVFHYVQEFYTAPA